MNKKCLFCEIAKGNIKIPGIFWENNEYMAFLSNYPNTKGFSVVIPKKHYTSDVLAMPDEKLSEFIIVAKKVSQILINYFVNVGRVGLIMEGMGIDHAHIKLVPMHETQYLKKGQWRQQSSTINKYFHKYEGYLASHCGPKVKDSELKKLAQGLKNTSLKINN